ncbi:GNAT family N-acetyltransferase [Deinococcus yavapaiensis]|uniref:L-amino acid N-acyltransferase YncA n=1 Tax=Deinococcus yavapaiensis KR-236 TaxID=694435 RepID=A0A318S6Q3_9DEIO|nr:GNAT family N-acetyltransferase [Deinococcus yavapaiensis]PYE53893.1 L-amino acid N-acyltransferase YncA [Deinococcus yavapaiensis KR-236]
MTTPPTSYTIRDVQPNDLAVYTAIVNTEETEPLTPEHLAELERITRERAIFRQRWVLEDAEGHMQGTASLFNFPVQPGAFYLTLVVTPEARGRGYGAALLTHAHDVALARGARTLQGSVRDINSASRAWAEQRGFSLLFHRFESTLDLTTFDEAAHAEVERRVADAGITFEDMRTLGNDEANWSRLYDFYADRNVETPDARLSGMPRMSVEESRQSLRESLEVRPEWMVLATRGDEWLGLSVLTSHPHGSYNHFTGVAPEARGLGLARALKVEVIRRARAAGFSLMITNNLSVNAPMLAVNRHLGFEARPGLWVMQRTLA